MSGGTEGKNRETRTAGRHAGGAAVGLLLALLSGTGGPWWAAPARAAGEVPEQRVLPSGLVVDLYPATYLSRHCIAVEGGRVTATFPTGEVRELIAGVDDPAILNRGDGSFHPMRLEQVVATLEALALGMPGLRVTIYLLPLPVRGIPDSHAEPGVIYLAPGTVELSDAAVAMTVAHEVGHVYQLRYLGSGDPRWRRYRALRGIEDESVFFEGAAHADRPREIFAEDFRVLFGGPVAASFAIENGALALPTSVPGLEAFLRDLSRAAQTSGRAGRGILELRNTPNPFNPVTAIGLRFAPEVVAAGAELAIVVYDVRGREIRALGGGRVTSEVMTVTWDGTDDAGHRVASGFYFYRVVAGGESATAKMLLAK